MTGEEIESFERVRLRERAFSRWNNEGGAGEGGVVHPASGEPAREVLPLTNAELVQLQIRVIALENLMTALLADAPGPQLDLVREIAAYISPRPGYTPHRLTIHAAARMISLTEAAGRLRELSFDKEAIDGPSDPGALL